MKNYERKQGYMSEWTDGSLINNEAIAKLSTEELQTLAQLLEKL
jgi:hypothetical protein